MSIPVTNFVRKVLALRRGEVRSAARDVSVGSEQEATGAAGRVDDPVRDRRLDDLDHRVNEGLRGKVLARSRLGIVGASLQQLFVCVAVHVGTGSRPVLLVDVVDDQRL